MYCKIIEEVYREPLGEIQFEKKAGKKWEGGKVFIEPLDGVQIFKGFVENPSWVLGIWEGCLQPLRSIVKKFCAGSA